jgi:hypothetical protein
VRVASASPFTGDPQDGQKREVSETSLEHDRQVIIFVQAGVRPDYSVTPRITIAL